MQLVGTIVAGACRALIGGGGEDSAYRILVRMVNRAVLDGVPTACTVRPLTRVFFLGPVTV